MTRLSRRGFQRAGDGLDKEHFDPCGLAHVASFHSDPQSTRSKSFAQLFCRFGKRQSAVKGVRSCKADVAYHCL